MKEKNEEKSLCPVSARGRAAPMCSGGGAD